MARPRNPLADAVTIGSDNRVWWYPSGLANVGKRRSRRCANRAEAERYAAERRAELAQVRAAIADEALPWSYRPIGDSFDAWIADLAANSPRGTRKAYESKIDAYGYLIGGNRLDEYGIDLYRQVLEAAYDPDHPSVLGAVRTALNSWTWWAIDEGHLSPHAITREEMTSVYRGLKRRLRRQLQRQRTEAKGQRGRGAGYERPTNDDGDADGHIGIHRSPTLEHVEAFARAIEERESKGDLSRRDGRLNAGGARPLDLGEAWRLSRSVPFAAASGARQCEMLAVHTSDIDLRTGEWRIDCQLDRYALWVPGEPLPLVPPKHGIERTTRFFKYYLPELEQLCAYADEHHDGYIFAPTRGQRHWAKAWEEALDRGLAHQRWQATQALATGDEPPPRWTWRRHYTRHFYGSWAMAPRSVGGLEWTEQATQKRMGHSSPKVTRDLYVHIVEDEDATWNASDHRPGEIL